MFYVITVGSECSSEISSFSSFTSPMQTGDDGKKCSKFRSSMNGGMNIDTKQLYDPDSLWKRNKSR